MGTQQTLTAEVTAEAPQTQALQVATPAPAPTLYHSPDAESFAMEQRMAKLFVKSGLFGDIKGTGEEQAIAQAWVKIGIGKSMGFSPAESMQGIDIIQGRPAVSAQLRAARMQRAGFTWSIDKLDDHGCMLTIYFSGKALGQAGYTEEDAKRANLIGKDNWKKDPSSMFFARAITRAQRRYAPGVLSGDIVSREEAYDVDFTDAPAQLEGGIQMPQRKAEQQTLEA